MTSFLMVVPPGWIELDNATAFVEHYNESSILNSIQQNETGTLDGMVEEWGQLPAGFTLAEMRLFREGNEFRVWFRVIPF
jgi:hypothetical protein